MTLAGRAVVALLAVTPAAPAAPAARAAEPPPSPRVQALVAALTPQEKVAQLQSAAPAVPRLKISAYAWWSEGLHGLARNGYATVFPQAIGLAATFDPGLLMRVGGTVAAEARAKFEAAGAGDHARYGGLTIWSPNVNIFRDPRWGRGQETYGEDPYLTARLAVGFVRGLQGPDPARPTVIATPKHLAVHSGPEAGRHGFDVDVSPQDLEATYLPAFRAALTEGGAQSVMCAYNALHGTPACASAPLLRQTVRSAWGFGGFVVSDCDAVEDMTRFHFFRPDDAGSSAASLKAGLDLNCGKSFAALSSAQAAGTVTQGEIDRALVRLLSARERLGALGGEAPGAPLPAADPAAADALALRAAEESIVLLKNRSDRLPLKAHGLKVAVVGPNADALESLEANYHGTARHPVTPLMGLRTILGEGAVRYAQGSAIAEGAPVTVPETALLTPDGRPGLRGEYFDKPRVSGEPRLVRTDRRVAFDWDRVAPDARLDPSRYAVRWRGDLAPPGPGDYALSVSVARCFDCSGHDRVRLWVDDALVYDDPGDAIAVPVSIPFPGGRPRRIRLELEHLGEDQGLRLQWVAPAAAQLAEARAAAQASDVTVAFVGLSPDVEGEELQVAIPGFEGGDRTDISLPAAQARLLEAVAVTGKPLVVVVMGGAGVALGQAGAAADAVLYAWYPGQAGGEAIARVLTGAVSPSGRLPVTVYRKAHDLPAFTDYRMAGRTYRYFAGDPEYPFGMGLSYTRFAYANLRLPSAPLKAGAAVLVRATVRNAGPRAGDEVAQLYLSAPPAPGRPTRELKGFGRVSLRPGESKEVVFTLEPRAFDGVDPAGRHAIAPGEYRVFVGGGQPGRSQGVSGAITLLGEKALPR